MGRDGPDQRRRARLTVKELNGQGPGAEMRTGEEDSVSWAGILFFLKGDIHTWPIQGAMWQCHEIDHERQDRQGRQHSRTLGSIHTKREPESGPKRVTNIRTDYAARSDDPEEWLVARLGDPDRVIDARSQ